MSKQGEGFIYFSLMPEQLKDTPEVYLASPAEQELLTCIKDDYSDAYNQRHKSYPHLKNRTIDQFWQDSRDDFDAVVDPDIAAMLEDWQSKDFKPKSRNKSMVASAMLISAGIGLDFAALDLENSVDREMSRVVDDVVDWSMEREYFDFKELMVVHEMTTVGTGTLFEDLVWEEREVKEIVGFDFETGEIKTKKAKRVDFKGPRAEVVPNEEIYPGDIWEPDVQKQPFMIRRKLTTWNSAKAEFDKYDNWDFVVPGKHSFFYTNDDDVKDTDISDDDNDIEIIWYWRKSDDTYAIVVQGILMTKAKAGFPYHHKQYPFAKGIALPFSDTRFFFGNSYVNLNADDQKIVNEFWRLMIDQSKLKLRPPIGTDNIEVAMEDIVVPGTTYPLEEGSRVEVLKEVAQGVGQAEFNMLTLAERQIDENTSDPVLSGKSPSGQPPTAAQINAIVGSADRLKTYSEAFYANLLMQFARLRIPNALFFLTHDKDFQQVVKADVKFSSGKTGKRKISFISSKLVTDLIETENELAAQQIQSEKEGVPMEFVLVTQEDVEDYRYRVTVSAVPKPRRNASTRLLQEIEKYRMRAQDPIIAKSLKGSTENTKQMLEAFGDDPDRFIDEQPPQTPSLAEEQPVGPGAAEGLPQRGQGGAPPQQTSAAVANALTQQG